MASQLDPSLSSNSCARSLVTVGAEELDGNLIPAVQRPCQRRAAGARLAQARVLPEGEAGLASGCLRWPVADPGYETRVVLVKKKIHV